MRKNHGLGNEGLWHQARVNLLLSTRSPALRRVGLVLWGWFASLSSVASLSVANLFHLLLPPATWDMEEFPEGKWVGMSHVVCCLCSWFHCKNKQLQGKWAPALDLVLVSLTLHPHFIACITWPWSLRLTFHFLGWFSLCFLPHIPLALTFLLSVILCLVFSLTDSVLFHPHSSEAVTQSSPPFRYHASCSIGAQITQKVLLSS